MKKEDIHIDKLIAEDTTEQVEPSKITVESAEIGRIFAHEAGIVLPEITSLYPAAVTDATMARAISLCEGLRRDITKLPLTDAAADTITICFSLLHLAGR